ncbi:M48 family metallopeptidase [Frigidibacter sp. ROC022]|uniref:M48 family metallopeptidase n=1 Tax=Frigidibacter sp. ROC022 TaxID=2971796 RepID=UPI00215A3D2E|nr:M48 family metallopeptidase [Frigidibacter sp. ROC022]MCR8726264.1 M48 family metallopeptidase [Frigidibacter sp. ROC022]
MIGRFLRICWLILLVGCTVPSTLPGPAPTAPPQVQDQTGVLPSPEVAARNFVTVVDRVEPVAEAFCRRARRDGNCDYGIYVASDVDLPPNAFQTVDADGSPVIVFTISLIAMARNQDELAFILGHEAAHHIAGHIDKAQAEALKGALILGTAAALGGADQARVTEAQRIGAAFGARRFSKEHELEADALGARIAYRAGYDPMLGAAYFDRLPDPGDAFLGTHPPNAARLATVARVTEALRAGG